MKITDNTSAVLREVAQRSSAGLKKLEAVIVSAAKKIVTVKTGALQNSTTAEVVGNKLLVGSPLKYAPKVEMDKPFLRPALMQGKDAAKSIFKAR